MSYVNKVRESVITYDTQGLESAELQDLLGVVIGSKATPELTGKLAARGVIELSKMTVQEFVNEGLSKLKALELLSSFLLAKKFLQVEQTQNTIIRSPEDGAAYVMNDISYEDQEHFVALFLNVQNQIIGKRTIFVGSMNESIVQPRDLFREAIKLSSASMIVFHNHPQGVLTPSQKDLDITSRLVESGKITGIEVLDHIIVGHGKHISLKEKGYM